MTAYAYSHLRTSMTGIREVLIAMILVLILFGVVAESTYIGDLRSTSTLDRNRGIYRVIHGTLHAHECLTLKFRKSKYDCKFTRTSNGRIRWITRYMYTHINDFKNICTTQESDLPNKHNTTRAGARLLYYIEFLFSFSLGYLVCAVGESNWWFKVSCIIIRFIHM